MSQREVAVGCPQEAEEVSAGEPCFGWAGCQRIQDYLAPPREGAQSTLALALDRLDAAELVEQRACPPLAEHGPDHLWSRPAQRLPPRRRQRQVVAGLLRQPGRLHEHRPGERLDRQIGGRLTLPLLLILDGIEVAAGQHFG